jgi:hypothetical protein
VPKYSLNSYNVKNKQLLFKWGMTKSMLGTFGDPGAPSNKFKAKFRYLLIGPAFDGKRPA